MRITMLGYFGGKNDEGMANYAFNLFNQLYNDYSLQKVNFSSFLLLNPKFWIKTSKYDPDIFHFIIGPTILGLIIMRIIKLFFRNSIFIISSMQPRFSKISEKFIRFLKPDLLLAQTSETEFFFNSKGYKTKIIPTGVDTSKFSPVSYDRKQELRVKYEIPSKFVVLHVGHIKKGRNLILLNEVCKNTNYQVIIIGSTYRKFEKDIFDELRGNGCIVLREYFENIQEFYQLSDCYVFPTTDKLNCIEMPLSVMEASSCNLPIISARYGDLEKFFGNCQGFYFFDNKESLIGLLEKVKHNYDEIKTRESVLKYSWEEIANQISEVHKDIRLKK